MEAYLRLEVTMEIEDPGKACVQGCKRGRTEGRSFRTWPKFALLNSVKLQFCFCIVRRGWATSKMLPLTRSRLQQHCASHGFPTAVKDARTLESLFLFSSLAFLSFACFGVCTALWSHSTEAVVETVTVQTGKPWEQGWLGVCLVWQSLGRCRNLFVFH